MNGLTNTSLSIRTLGLLAGMIAISILLLVYMNFRTKTQSRIYSQLDSLMFDSLRCPKIEKNGTIRVYVSAGMFDLADTLYAVGIDGIRPGLNYLSINLVDMICNFSVDQMKVLTDLCVLWDVPSKGIINEIEKVGWECFCPVRDGITMATVAAAISQAQANPAAVFQEYDATAEGVRPFSKSLFRKENLLASVKSLDINQARLMGIKSKDPSDSDLISYAQNLMFGALGTNVGANDLYNMYSTCNVCIMGYNGIQPDSGAIAEVGQLGARGVPCVIIHGSFIGDFGGVINPMPVMAATADRDFGVRPNLTNNPGSVFTGSGALPWLQKRVQQFIDAQESGLEKEDPMTFVNYNHEFPLPPLQIFWSDLGSKCFFLKHRNKSIGVKADGTTDFKKDYTKFWYDNMTGTKGDAGMIQIAKAMADNLDDLKTQPKYRNVYKYWS
jgi:hypothetical protein